MGLQDLTGEFKTATPWDTYVPMTQAQAEEILKRDMPGGTRVSIRVDEDGNGRVSIKSGDIDEARNFSLADRLLDSGYLELTRNARGKGIGRYIMRNEIEFFRACGVKKFHIYASLDNGGYTWARLGFLPEQNSKSYNETIDTVRKRLQRLAPLLSEDEKQRLGDIAQFRDPRDIWRLADASVDLRQRLVECFNKAADGDWDALSLRGALLNMDGSIDKQIRGTKDVLIGRLLLTGTSWYGNLHFDDAEQMTRVEKYVGGWIGIPEARKQPEPTNDNDQQLLSNQPVARAAQAAYESFPKPPSLIDRLWLRLGL